MWHYSDQGTQAGPISQEELARLFQEGKINGDTFIWQAGQDGWRAYREIFPEVAPAPMAAVPPAGLRLAGGAPIPGHVACVECGTILPEAETVRLGEANVCAACKPRFLQKLAEGVSLPVGPLAYADIGRRFLAVLLDGVLLFAVNFLTSLAVTGTAPLVHPGEPPQFHPMQLIASALNMALGIGYETYLIGRYGATVGKLALGIKVVTADGGRVGYGRALGRYFAKILSGLTCFIGYIIALFDKEKRALHDHLCNTRVVMK